MLKESRSALLKWPILSTDEADLRFYTASADYRRSIGSCERPVDATEATFEAAARNGEIDAERSAACHASGHWLRERNAVCLYEIGQYPQNGAAVGCCQSKCWA